MTGHAYQLLLADDDQRAFAAALHGHLVAGARFAFESGRARYDQNTEPRFLQRYEDPRHGPVEVWIEHRYDPDTQLVHYMIRHRHTRDGSETAEPFVLRHSTDDAIRDRFGRAGFACEAAYGDWYRAPVGEDADERIYVFQRL